MKGPISYEVIDFNHLRGVKRGEKHFRVRDADDNRIATCYVEANAQEIVRLMNLGLKAEPENIG